jgi:hypothetical protein
LKLKKSSVLIVLIFGFRERGREGGKGRERERGRGGREGGREGRENSSSHEGTQFAFAERELVWNETP